MPQLPLNLPEALRATQWKAILDPVIASPMVEVSFLVGISLINGNTTINHKLGRMMRGWFVADINGAATIYRSQPMNSTTLTLNSSAAVTVNIGVF